MRRPRQRRGSSSSSLSKRTSSPIESAKADAYRWIARRIHTREEIRTKLRRRGHSEEIIQETLESLTGLGYVDDSAFAREWCRYRLDSHPLGIRGLLRELAGKGVPSQIAEEAVREAYKEIDETDVARRLAFQRVEKGCDIRSAKGNRRLRDFLLRRGFSFETIGNALSAVAELSVQESSMQESVQDPSWSALRDEVHDT